MVENLDGIGYLKRCGGCKNLLPEERFPKHRLHKDGLDTICTRCKVVRNRGWRERNTATCTRCGGPCDFRVGTCRTCHTDTTGGVTNWATLARDPGKAWEIRGLYLTEVVLLNGANVLKVGIGPPQRARSHGGSVLYHFRCPRVVAYHYEQATLREAGQAPVPAELWPSAGGRTEVVADREKALEIFQAIEEDPWALEDPELLERLHGRLLSIHHDHLEETS